MQPDRILVAGETLVDLFPDGAGALADVEGFQHRPGGAPANVAAGLARFGDPPAFWTRLGGDAFGEYLHDALAGHGLDGEFVVHSEDPTALAVVAPTADGDREFTFYEQGTATLDFQRGAIPDDALAAHDAVHIGGVALATPTGRDAMLDLAERARDQDCLVSFDPNYRPELWRDAEDTATLLREAIGLADVVCCSADDLEPLGLAELARRDPEAVAVDLLDAGPDVDLLDAGPDTVFLTRGSDGATVVSDATASDERVVHSLPAFDVDVVDATGAGDAFCAGVLSAFEPELHADDLRDVLAFGSAAGALATTDTGGMAALPDAEAVRRLAETAVSR